MSKWRMFHKLLPLVSLNIKLLHSLRVGYLINCNGIIFLITKHSFTINTTILSHFTIQIYLNKFIYTMHRYFVWFFMPGTSVWMRYTKFIIIEKKITNDSWYNIIWLVLVALCLKESCMKLDIGHSH